MKPFLAALLLVFVALPQTADAQWTLDGLLPLKISRPYTLPKESNERRAKLFKEQEQLMAYFGAEDVEPYATMWKEGNRNLTWFRIEVSPTSDKYYTGILEIELVVPGDTLSPVLVICAKQDDNPRHEVTAVRPGMSWEEAYNDLGRYEVWAGFDTKPNAFMEFRRGGGDHAENDVR